MSSTVNFKNVAKSIMFGQKSITEKELIEQFKLEYRAGKDFTDIEKSIQKSFKNGHGKTENELGFLELYLSQVFKKKESSIIIYSKNDIDDYKSLLSSEDSILLVEHANKWSIKPVICAWYDDLDDFHEDWCDVGLSKTKANFMLNKNKDEFLQFDDGRILRLVK